MTIFTLFGITIGIIWTHVTILYIISIIIKRNDIADIAWGPGIAIVALTGLFFHTNPQIFTILLTGAVCIWALRLGIRIGMRNAKKSEDPRYAQWRKDWGKWFYLRSYGQVYLLQGTLMVVMGYPFLHSAVFGAPTSLPFFTTGLIIWCAGFIFEIIGDYQLDQFLSHPTNKGKIMQSGLWRYSRHPNYFGEITLWWGLWIAFTSVPYNIITLVSPLLITILITKVSGIPMAEKHLGKNSAFEAYKKKTSILIPLPQHK